MNAGVAECTHHGHINIVFILIFTKCCRACTLLESLQYRQHFSVCWQLPKDIFLPPNCSVLAGSLSTAVLLNWAFLRIDKQATDHAGRFFKPSAVPYLACKILQFLALPRYCLTHVSRNKCETAMNHICVSRLRAALKSPYKESN